MIFNDSIDFHRFFTDFQRFSTIPDDFHWFCMNVHRFFIDFQRFPTILNDFHRFCVNVHRFASVFIGFSLDFNDLHRFFIDFQSFIDFHGFSLGVSNDFHQLSLALGWIWDGSGIRFRI